MNAWKRRNRRRRTSLKELGPRRRLNVTVEIVDKSECKVPPSEVHLPQTYIFAPRGPV